MLGDDQRVPWRPRREKSKWTLQLSVFRPVEKLQAPLPGRIQRVKSGARLVVVLFPGL